MGSQNGHITECDFAAKEGTEIKAMLEDKEATNG